MSQIIGHISQVIGPVVDVYFEGKDIDTDLLLPSIHDALTIKRNDGRILVVEVQQHIGEDTVRTWYGSNSDRASYYYAGGQPDKRPADERSR